MWFYLSVCIVCEDCALQYCSVGYQFCNVTGQYSLWRYIKLHNDVIKWKYFPRYWPFVRGIHGEFPIQRQWRGTLMFTLICARINGSVNNREAGDLRRHRAHYDVIVMCKPEPKHHACTFLIPYQWRITYMYYCKISSPVDYYPRRNDNVIIFVSFFVSLLIYFCEYHFPIHNKCTNEPPIVM